MFEYDQFNGSASVSVLFTINNAHVVNELFSLRCNLLIHQWILCFVLCFSSLLLIMNLSSSSVMCVDSHVCVLCIRCVDFHTLKCHLIIEKAKNSEKFPRSFMVFILILIHDFTLCVCFFFCCCFSGIWNRWENVFVCSMDRVKHYVWNWTNMIMMSLMWINN